uniref:Uncharacterized protein n=1 Tax=Fagus sylvatica TaxID=28930 RepID=A0A2N9ETM5_FAGSY
MSCLCLATDNLVLEAWAKLVNDLMLLDGERVEVDLFQGFYLIGMDEASQLRHWNPFLLLFAAPIATPSSPAISPRPTAAEAFAEATAFASL